ncbi:hypothetical protein OC844_001999 [Tilletia horrida]|nr:hypothetical protein OC844_001999 [Tilletia horrida]
MQQANQRQQQHQQQQQQQQALSRRTLAMTAFAPATPARALAAEVPAITKPPPAPGQPLHVLLTPAELAQRKRQQQQRQQQQEQQRSSGSSSGHLRRDGEQIVGPFWARSEDDVRRAKLEWDAEQALKRRARPAAGLADRDAAEYSQNLVQRRPAHAGADAAAAEDRSLGPVLSDDEWDQMRRASERSTPEMEHIVADLERRQTAAEEKCYVGNAQLSCYPTSGLQIPQGTWSKFIWNSYFPLFIQQDYVDVYLYREDQDRIQTSWTSQVNKAGRISFSPNDAWWEDRPRAQNIQPGQNISWPFYFVVNPAGLDLGGTTIRQSTWYAIQTALPAALASSRSVAAAASASAATATYAAISSSIASQLSAELQSSLNAQGFTGTQTLVGSVTTVLPDGQTVIITATGKANGTLSGGDGDNTAGTSADDGSSGPKKWVIPVIVVLGFLALVLFASVVYLCMRRARRRTAAAGGAGGGGAGARESTGSGSPMMRDIGAPGALGSLDGAASPVGTHSNRALSAAGGPDSSIGYSSAAGGAAAGGAAVGAGALPVARSVRSSGDSHLFSSEEASRMADAFRNALRKPEFTAGGAFGATAEMESPREEDAESPAADDRGSPIAGALGDAGRDSPTKVAPALLKQELASEGKDLRRVGDRKKAQFHEEEQAGPAGTSAEEA